MMTGGRGVGYGKVILFGEHFVVHGAAAIAAGIANAAIVRLERSDKNSIITEAPVISELSLAAIGNVLASLDIREKYAVYMEGDLPTYGGLGSSAAFCVALTRALAEDQHINLSDEQVNRHAYEGEKAFHGDPSGIDNLMATYGGVMEFKRGKTPAENRYERVVLKKPLNLVVSFTGKFGLTPKMVEAVRKFKEEDEDEFGQLMDEYSDLELEARKSLEKGKLDLVGELMNSNQNLLSELGVSDEANDRIIQLSLGAGALGAKLTGGGGGGCCIALGRDGNHCKELAQKLSSAGFRSFCTTIGK